MKDLIKRLKTGENGRDINREIKSKLSGLDTFLLSTWRNYTSSLEDCRYTMEAFYPDFSYELTKYSDGNYHVYIWDDSNGGGSNGAGPTLENAWMIAMLEQLEKE